MRLVVSVGAGDVLRWHVQLVDDLRGEGHEAVLVAHATGRPRPPEGLGRRIERVLYRIPSDHPTAPVHTPAPAGCAGEADLTIDLGGGATAGRILVPRFDGVADPSCLIRAVREQRSPRLDVVLQDDPGAPQRVVAQAVPAITDPGVLVRALDQYAQGVARAILQLVRRIARGQPLPALAPAHTSPADGRHRGSFLVGSLSRKLASRVRRLTSGDDHWRIGLRPIGSDGVRETCAWAEAPYRFLPDDGERYYADPFLFVHDGVVHGFCEELVYATGKGILSHFTASPDGAASTPRPILERPYHLSYPNVFAHDADIFMIPESTANRTVELFRATHFPDRWEKVCDLLADVSAADATLLEHDGRFWLFAAVADDGGSDRDALGLFYADRLTGPWTAHPLNPVVLNVHAARPGGHMYRRGSALMRPAQDCRGGYGAALTLCEVTRLDPDGYEQRIVAHLAPQPRWRATGTHTLNAAGGLEAIDCLTPRRRPPG